MPLHVRENDDNIHIIPTTTNQHTHTYTRFTTNTKMHFPDNLNNQFVEVFLASVLTHIIPKIQHYTQLLPKNQCNHYYSKKSAISNASEQFKLSTFV